MPRGKSRTRLSSAYGSAYQRKTKTGHWTINYYDTSGKRIQRVAKGAQTRQEAMIVLHNAVRKAERGSAGQEFNKRKDAVAEAAVVVFAGHDISNFMNGKTDFRSGLDAVKIRNGVFQFHVLGYNYTWKLTPVVENGQVNSLTVQASPICLWRIQ